MRDAGNKEVMAKNLRHYMAENNVTARELSRTLKFPYTTVVSWINADNYPRIDKIEAMADYFGIQKSDLIEDKKEPAENDGLTENQKALMDFVKSVPEHKAAMILKVIQSIVEAD